MQAGTNAGWHVAKWGLWGWIETGLKMVSIIAGFIAFFGANGSDAFEVGGNPHLAALILLAVMSLMTVVVVGLRFTQREIISIGFAILNMLGHFALLYSLLGTPDQQALPVVFGVFYALGEVAKQRFLTITGYTESGQTTSAMLNFSRGVAVVYIIFAVLVLI